VLHASTRHRGEGLQIPMCGWKLGTYAFIAVHLENYYEDISLLE